MQRKDGESLRQREKQAGERRSRRSGSGILCGRISLYSRNEEDRTARGGAAGPGRVEDGFEKMNTVIFICGMPNINVFPSHLPA